MPRIKVGRFGWLLASLLGLLILTPFAELLDLTLPSSRLLSTAVLLTGVYSLRGEPWMFRAGFALAFLALVAAWTTQHFDTMPLVMADYLLTGSFLWLTTALILARILSEAHVSLDTVMGGICVYLLVGVSWVSFYSALEYAFPGSFTMGGVAVSVLPDARPEAHRFPELLYFSFVTLTTLGYGDVVPANPPARALATAEAVVGQVYLAVFVASLVGLHLAERTRH